MPAVRVVVPTFQGAALLAEAIASVQAQTFGDFEIIVADDGSEDNTPEVVLSLARQDPRIRYLRLPHGGVSAARNAAIEVPGDFTYVAFLDSDDLWFPHHLQNATRVLNGRSEIGWLFARFDTIDPKGFMTPEQMARRIRSGHRPVDYGVRVEAGIYELSARAMLTALVRADFSPLPTTVVVRASTVAAPWFDVTLVALEDCSFYLRLAAEGHLVAFCDEVHGQVRLHGANATLQRDLASPYVLRKCQSCLRYGLSKRQHCQSAEDNRFVRREVADAAYLTGQCCAEQHRFAEARAAYFQALRVRPSGRAVRGWLAATLPASLKRLANRIRRVDQGAAKLPSREPMSEATRT